MRSDQDRSIPTPNAFERGFLERIGERDEPPTGPEADVAGPWIVEEIPSAGFGVYRSGEGLARRFRPAGVFHDRSVALLAAAALPSTGRDAAFRLGGEPERAGYVPSATSPASSPAIFSSSTIP